MGWDFCNSGKVKRTRKNHKCEFCGRIIPKGSVNILNWSGKFEGDMQNSYACHWCENHQSNLVDDYDNTISDFWDSLREDIFQEEFRKFKDCDCVDEKGMTGCIEANLEDDYLIFKCEDCGKEWHREHMPITT